jgi:undecaprenyl-phosphate glucose phosphotransferase
MVSPRIEDAVPEPNDGSAVVTTSRLRPRDRWRSMNSPAEILRYLALPSAAAAPESRVLLVGARRDVRRLKHRLASGPWNGPHIVGFVATGHGRFSSMGPHNRQIALHPQTDPVPVLGSIDRLNELVDRARATHVVVAVSGNPGSRGRPPVTQVINSGVIVQWILVDSGRLDLGPLTTSSPSTTWTVHSVGSAGNRAGIPIWDRITWARSAKRTMDFLIALLALLVLIPLFAVVGLSILITSGRPIFYTQDRVGQGGRLFRIIKFRSMKCDAERETGPIWASDHDQRCTRIGDWLRHSNIDELPQLWNVLRGDMSLVGPRPERPSFVDQFRQTIADYNLRHAVPGGMTGWAQVHGWRGPTSLRKRIQYDLDYIERWSPGLDIRILLMTVQHVLWGKISWKESKRPAKMTG